MLRRMTGFTAVCTTAAGVRTICQFSDSNPVLKDNAAHRGFKSTIWVEESDKYWFDKVTEVLSGELPTECQAPSRIELYNFDQLVKAPEEAKKGAFDKLGQYSFKTGNRYSGKFSQELEAFKSANKLDHNWWLSPAEIRKQDLKVKAGQRPCVQIITRVSKFFNADQFANPKAIQMYPFSGATGRAYDSTVGDVMRQHAEANGFRSCVYFTLNQGNALGLSTKVGVQGAEIPFLDRADFRVYSVDDVEHSAEFLKKLQRYPPKVPTYVISGKPVEEELLKAIAASNVPNKTNYWVSKNDVTNRQFKLREGAQGVAPKTQSATGATSWTAFNSEQFLNPEQVVAAVGRYKPTLESSTA